jgi:acid phosphatase/tartrate-resistant acid phosphatase type 5
LKPLLEQYKASGHLSGHDHCLEFIDEGKGPVYPVTGAGDNCWCARMARLAAVVVPATHPVPSHGASYSNKNVHVCPSNSIKFAVWNDGSGSPMVGGYGSFTATAESLQLRFHAANGTVLYLPPPVLPRNA